MSDQTPIRPEPGKWWTRVSHASIGVVQFLSQHKPILTFSHDVSILTLVIDENTYVMPQEGFRLLWRFYTPKAGEDIILGDTDDIFYPEHGDTEQSGEAVSQEPTE